MAYVIQNGESGYSREDFMSALEGKQDVLQSSVNIKTINGQGVMGGGNLQVTAREYSYDLTQEETALKNQAIELLNTDNPIDSQTGKRKYLSFGFLSDLHTTPTQAEVLEDDSVPQSIKEQWPDFTTTGGGRYPGRTCEPTLKVLGAFADETELDAVICGGDFSSGALPFDCYQFMLGRISQMFEKYVSVPYFTVDGNHDRRYSSSVRRRTNGEWRTFLESFNKPRGLAFSYAEDKNALEDRKSNCGYIDFADKKIRVILRSQYEKPQADSSTSFAGGGGTASTIELPGDDKKDWTVISVSHTGEYGAGKYVGYLSSDSFGNPRNQSYIGRGAVGEIRGHNHMSIHSRTEFTLGRWGGTGGNYSNICDFYIYLVAEAFTVPSSPEYCFSLITIDTDNKRVIERKIGRAYHGSAPSGSEVGNGESTYIGYYGHIADISNLDISCEYIGDNKYKLSLANTQNKPFVKWSIGDNNMKNFLELYQIEGVITINETMTEAKTFTVTARSATSINKTVTVGPYVDTETNE